MKIQKEKIIPRWNIFCRKLHLKKNLQEIPETKVPMKFYFLMWPLYEKQLLNYVHYYLKTIISLPWYNWPIFIYIPCCSLWIIWTLHRHSVEEGREEGSAHLVDSAVTVIGNSTMKQLTLRRMLWLFTAKLLLAKFIETRLCFET